ncbi:MAG TPA: amino acid permease [Bryobacteraceae bacterium]|nr:amino acid permease [Bryobacteraceae bacterium]
MSAHARSPSPEVLPRRLGALDATVIVIGIVIGSGIFVLPNLIARDLPSGAAILAVWIVSGVLSFFGALAYAELGAMMPATGGQYVYLREAYGPMCAFVCGWTFMLAVLAGGSAWLAVTFSIYLGHFVPLAPATAKAVSVALIAVLSAVNYVGVKEGLWVQRTFTFLKIVGLLVLIGAAFLSPRSADTAPAPPPFSLAHFGMAMSACLMAYNGWSYVSFVAGEVREPARNLLRSLIIGMTVVAALYCFANAAYLRVMTVPQIALTARVGADVAGRTMGPWGAAFVSLTVLLSIIGAVNGCILTAARIPFAQARDGLFFARFGQVHPRFQTPAFAILLGGVWTAVLVLTGSYETLYSYSILAAWIFYTMSVAAVFVLRRKLPDADRPYRMWGYPFTLWAFVIVSVWFMLNAITAQPRPSLMAFVIVSVGVAAYGLWRKLTRRICVALLLVAGSVRPCSILVSPPPLWKKNPQSSASLFRFVMDDRVGYIDAAGRIAIPARYDNQWGQDDFSDGLVRVESDGHVSYVDDKGHTRLSVVYEMQLGSFSEGLVSYYVLEPVADARTADGCCRHLYGYLGQSGTPVIQAQFGETAPFSEGLAAVREEAPASQLRRAGYIDKTGRWVNTGSVRHGWAISGWPGCSCAGRKVSVWPRVAARRAGRPHAHQLRRQP